MNNNMPKFRQAPTTTIPHSQSGSHDLVGKSMETVIRASMQKLMEGKGRDKHHGGDHFLNCMTPGLALWDDITDPDAPKFKTVPGIWANFDNDSGSDAVAIASKLSQEYLKTGTFTDYVYTWKLIDAVSLKRVGGDYPQFEEVTESADDSDIPDFMKPDVIVRTKKAPKAGVVAYLHIYASKGDGWQHVASNDLLEANRGHYNTLVKNVEDGKHIQVAVRPQVKVANWNAAKDTPTATVAGDLTGFATV